MNFVHNIAPEQAPEHPPTDPGRWILSCVSAALPNLQVWTGDVTGGKESDLGIMSNSG